MMICVNIIIYKNEGLPESFVFPPIAIETIGRCNSSAMGFITEIGRRTSSITGDVRETVFLYQSLCLHPNIQPGGI